MIKPVTPISPPKRPENDRRDPAVVIEKDGGTAVRLDQAEDWDLYACMLQGPLWAARAAAGEWLRRFPSGHQPGPDQWRCRADAKARVLA